MFSFAFISDSEEEANDYIKDKRPVFPVKYRGEKCDKFSRPEEPQVMEIIELSSDSDLDQSSNSEQSSDSESSDEVSS